MEIRHLINENTVFHCDTKQKATEFIKKAYELGYRWKVGRGINKTHYSGYGNETCYRLYRNDKIMTFADIDCFRKKCLTIIEYELDTVEEEKMTPLQYLMDYLGVEDGEEFNIVDKRGEKRMCCPYMFVDGDLLNCYQKLCNETIFNLMNESLSIEKLPRKPKGGEPVAYFGIDGTIYSRYFRNNVLCDLAMLKCGWLFHSKEEAEANKERILKEYAEVMCNY